MAADFVFIVKTKCESESTLVAADIGFDFYRRSASDHRCLLSFTENENGVKLNLRADLLQ